MELSKEDLEKIIKGVAEVIGVKKESAEVEQKDGQGKTALMLYLDSLENKKKIDDYISSKKVVFFKDSVTDFNKQYEPNYKKFLKFKANEEHFTFTVDIDNKIETFIIQTNEDTVFDIEENYNYNNKFIGNFDKINKNRNSKKDDIKFYFKHETVGNISSISIDNAIKEFLLEKYKTIEVIDIY